MRVLRGAQGGLYISYGKVLMECRFGARVGLFIVRGRVLVHRMVCAAWCVWEVHLTLQVFFPAAFVIASCV